MSFHELGYGLVESVVDFDTIRVIQNEMELAELGNTGGGIRHADDKLVFVAKIVSDEAIVGLATLTRTLVSVLAGAAEQSIYWLEK